MYIIWLAVCIWAMPLVYAAISKKSVFNFRAWDNKMLTLTPSCIWVGKQQYNIHDLKIELHINAYDGFKYPIRRKGILVPQTTYGDNNLLYFQYEGLTYDVEFHLRDLNSYITLYKLIDQWREAGVPVIIKEMFTREFMHKQYEPRKRSGEPGNE